MRLPNYPRAAEIRAALLARAGDHQRRSGTPLTVIAKNALNDTSFLHRVRAGKNFTLRSYHRLMTWLDRQQLYERQVKRSSRRRR